MLVQLEMPSHIEDSSGKETHNMHLLYQSGPSTKERNRDRNMLVEVAPNAKHRVAIQAQRIVRNRPRIFE